MIIVISNRTTKEHKINQDGYASVKYFGEKLADPQGISTRMAVASYSLVEDLDVFDEDGELNLSGGSPVYDWTLRPIKQNNETALLSEVLEQVDTGKLSKKWLFFLHGNNQTTLKNLEKCRQIEQLHDVNVIAFSWPSWGKLFSKELILKIGSKILKEGSVSKSVVVSALGSAIDIKKEKYREAVENAITSKYALHNTLNKIKSEFIQPAKLLHAEDFKISLLVHSLGNRVMEYMIKDDGLNDLNDMFDNVILHQADVNAKDHHLWVSKIKLGDRVYITHNRKDAVLHISDVFGSNEKRLGHKDGGVRCTAEQVAAYIDFTKGMRVGINHGLFLMRDIYSEKTNDCFNALLSGEYLFVEGHLPVGFSQRETNVFKMQKEYMVHEVEEDWP